MSWPQWSAGTQPPVPSVLNPAQPVINSAPAVVPPGMQYTPEQWAQLQQQNWNQWAQWQQQYQQWHQQYGAEYQKSINALAQAAQVQQLPNVAVPPPLPVEAKQPPPPTEEPPPNLAAYTTAPPPPPPQPARSQAPQGYNTVQLHKATEQHPPVHYPKNNQNWHNRDYRYGQENKRPYDQGIDHEAKRPLLNKLDWQTQPPPPQPTKPRENIEELSEAEKKFDKQFAEWEAQFNKWKEQNAEHPDKEQYREYEKKWESWRAQLLERREQMKRKRLGLSVESPNRAKQSPGSNYQSYNSPQQGFNQGYQSQQSPLPPKGPPKAGGLLPLPGSAPGSAPFNKPPPNMNDEPLKFKEYKSVPELDDNVGDFLKPNIGGGIPGLDLVKDDPKMPGKESDDVVVIDPEEKERKGPDFDAISKGINTILGDQKLLNMLSLVSQNQNAKQTDNLTNTVSRIKDGNVMETNSQLPPFPEQSNQSYEEQSNHSETYGQREFVNNFDDQTRSSFTMAPNEETRFEGQGNFNRNQNQFGNRFGNFKGNRFSGPDDQFNRGPPEDRFGSNEDRFGPNQDRFRPNQDRFGPNQQRFGPNQDNFGPNQDRFGPNQDRFGPNQNRFGPGKDRFGPNQDRFGPGQDKFGPNQDRFGFGQDRFGPNKDKFGPGPNKDKFGPGPNQEKFGPGQDRFGANQEKFGPGQDRFGSNQEKFGPAQDRFGPNQEKFGPGPDRFGPNQEKFGPGQDRFGAGPVQEKFGPGQDRFGANQEKFGPGQDRFGPNQEKFGPGQDRFGLNQEKFGPGQDRFGPNQTKPDSNQGRFGNNQNKFGPNKDRFGPNQDRFGPNQENRFGPNQDNFTPNQDRFDQDNFPVNQDRFGPNQNKRFGPNQDRFNRQGPNQSEERFPNLNNRNVGPQGQFGFDGDGPNQGRFNDFKGEFEEHCDDYDYDAVAATFESEEPNVPPKDVEDQWEKDESFPTQESKIEPEVPEKKTDEIFQPTTVIDYDHKPSKNCEPEVLIEPIYMFDYRHKPISRIPLPQRPKWLSETVKNIREFDPPVVRPYEPPNLRRYPPSDNWRNDRYQENRPPHNRRGYDERPPFEERRSYNDRPYENNRNSKNDWNAPKWEDKKPYNDDRNYHHDDRRPPPRMDFEEEKISDTEWPEDEEMEEPKPLFPKFQKMEEPKPTANKNVVLIEDLISPPGRYKRPPRLVIILRGPPGSGKTFLAKLIKDKEVENGGSAPRILSLDDYFMIEQEKEVTEDGKKVKVKEMVYEYEAEMEESYRSSLIKSFKKTITDGYFSFIIVDNVNDKVKYFGEMWSFAKQNGFQVYICQLDLDVQTCSKRNIHGRSEADIEKSVANWEATPSHHPTLDATSLLQSASIPEVEMEEVNSPESDVRDPDEVEDQVARSKWDNFDCSVDNLAKLDGVSKPLRHRTMEEYLQLDTDWTPVKPPKPGQKRVRWADLEEQKQQEKMRAIGFVVGHTNWNRMMDPTGGSSALTQTKYIERTGRYKVDQK